MLFRQLIRCPGKIIWYSMPVQLPAGPVQPGKMGGQAELNERRSLEVGARQRSAGQQLPVNFLGTFAVTQAFAPVPAKNGGGAIANLNSVASAALRMPHGPTHCTGTCSLRRASRL